MRCVSAETGRPVLSREMIGPVIGGRPVWPRRAGLGWLAGRRYPVIWMVGRRTGHVRRVAVTVRRLDPATGEVLVAARTSDAHWCRDVCATPATEVWLAGRRFHAAQRLLAASQIADPLLEIRRGHPLEARILPAFFRWPWPGSTEGVASLAASLGGASSAPARRTAARDA